MGQRTSSDPDEESEPRQSDYSGRGVGRRDRSGDTKRRCACHGKGTGGGWRCQRLEDFARTSRHTRGDGTNGSESTSGGTSFSTRRSSPTPSALRSGRSRRRSNGSGSRRTPYAGSGCRERCSSPLHPPWGRTVPLVRAGYPGAEKGHEPFALTRYGANVEVSVSPLVPDGKLPLEAVTRVLIDTGAEESCIDVELARRLRMPVVDTVAIVWGGGTCEHDVYAGNVVVHDLQLGVQGRFVGTDFIPGDIPQEVILGRTLLEGTIMIYDGLKGEVTLVSQPGGNDPR